MKNRAYTFLVFSFFTYIGVFSQNNDGGNFNSYITDPYANIIPPTPNASNFIQYGNTSVNASSGLPSISIPLFTIEEDGVQVPISLTYNASGIKVDDISSTVGLKWTLNAGGMISRTINDLDDFEENYGWTQAGSMSHFDIWRLNNTYYDFEELLNRELFQTFISQVDNFPDNFNYNFLNYSGSFVLKTHPEIDVVFSDYSNKIQIEDIGGDAGFNVNDLMGNTFNFTAFYEKNKSKTLFYYEATDDYPTPVEREESIVSWMLESIDTKNGNKINFSYDEYAYDDDTYYSQQLVTALGYECVPGGYPYGSDSPGNHLITSDKLKTTKIESHTKNQLVRYIYTDNVEVEFIYLDGLVNGESVSGWDKRIDKIIIEDKLKGKEKYFQFTYGTFNGDKRLKLLQIQEMGFDNSMKPPYIFNYDETPLPEVGSFAKDYKGYYNGKDDNNTLFPLTEKTATRKTENTNFSPPFIQYPGRDKLSDRYFQEPKLKAGILTKINYPTGGSTEFNYEVNAHGTNDLEPLITVKDGYIDNSDYNNVRTYGDGTNSLYFEAHKYIYSKLIEINNLVGPFVSHITGMCVDCNCYCPEITDVVIYKYNGDATDSPEDYFNSGKIGNTPVIKINFDPNNLILYNNSFDSSQGNGLYIVMLRIGDNHYPTNSEYIPPPTNNWHSVSVNFDWFEKQKDFNGDTIFQKHYFGGLRIKEIMDIDESNTSYNLTKYKYLEGYADNPFDSEKCVQTIAGQDVFTPDPQVELHGTQITNGYHYSHVEIEKINANAYGKTEEFYLPKYNFLNVSGGELYKKKIFDKDQNLLQLDSISFVTSESNEFKLEYYIPSAQNYVYGRFYSCQPPFGNPIELNWPISGYNNDYVPQRYHGRWRLPSTSRSTQFLKGGNTLEPITTVTTYDYTDDLLLEKETIDTRYTATVVGEEITGYSMDNPNGEVITTDYMYTKDPSITPPLTVPAGLTVRKEVANSTTKVVGQAFEYDGQGNIKNTYRYNKGVGTNSGPSYVPADYELDVSYLTDLGKPTQVKGRDGVYVSYIWGYNKQYPVAKIVGLTYASAIATPGFDLAGINASSDAQAIQEEIKKIRVAHPSAQVTTYTYNPMVGVNSVTDPKGLKNTYYYDGFGRLKYVKDQDGNVLGKNEYHYKND